MKLTKSKLRQLVREELNEALPLQKIQSDLEHPVITQPEEEKSRGMLRRLGGEALRTLFSIAGIYQVFQAIVAISEGSAGVATNILNKVDPGTLEMLKKLADAAMQALSEQQINEKLLEGDPERGHDR